jgi:DNA-binding Lrp family transcriptional regulator
MEESKDNINNRLVRVDFECNSVPRFSKPAGKKYISWGQQNAYPNFLLDLYKRDAIHGSIVKAKSEYVYGKGLTYNKDELTILEQAQYQQFLSSANDTEDWNDIFRKNCEPMELMNGIALEVVWKLNGKCDVFSFNPGFFRTNEDGSKYYYCENWVNENGEENPSPDKDASWREFNKFNPSKRKGSQILFYKAPFESLILHGKLYPEPNYIQCIQDVETNIEITNFHYNHMKNGMFGAAMMTFFNGEPTPEEVKKFVKKFKATYNGTNNTGNTLLYFADKGATAPDHKPLSQPDLDKMFEVVGKRLQQNIFTGHRFDPILGGIMQEGQLGGAKEILEKYDKFIKTYIQYRQELHLNVIKLIGEVNGVDLSQLEVKQTSPIMETLPTDPSILSLFPQDVLQKYYAKKYGIETDDKEIEVSEMASLPVNDNIKKLTGREYQRLQSLIAKYKSGKATYEEVAHFIKGYGLGQDYVDIVLGAKKFSSHINIISLFEAAAIDDNAEDEIIHEEFVGGNVFALNSQFNAARKFAADINSQVLEVLKGDPTLTPEKIAKQLGITPEEASTIIDSLTIAGLIVLAEGLISVTPLGIDTKSVNVEYETYTVYSYATRPDVPKVESSSRPFCTSLMAMSSSGKRWTKDAIDNISNSSGEDAWTYRGGFYTNPNTQETTPYCRHCWKSITKVRKKQ